MLRRILRGVDGVTVLVSDDLLVDVILREDIGVLFRGIRDDKDRDYEERQLGYHRLLLPPTRFPEVKFLPARKDLRAVASSLIKSFVSLDVDVSRMVHRFVKARLEMRLKGQLFLGVTGQMGTGKTYVADRLAAGLTERGVAAHYLNLDELVRALYEEQKIGRASCRERV